jgi:hypothetical protein
VFLLYAVLIGLAAGLVLGGRPGRLGEMRLRWTWLIVAGMLVQGLLYSEPVSERVAQLGPDVGPVVYITSMVIVLAAVVRNVRIPGLALVAIGAAANLAAIVANRGYMPASAEALGGHLPSGGGYSNSVVLADPALAPLTDIFALPDWLPAGNVFSVGDVLIGVGIAAAIVVQMRRGAPSERPVAVIAMPPEASSRAGARSAARCGPTTPPSGRRD